MWSPAFATPFILWWQHPFFINIERYRSVSRYYKKKIDISEFPRRILFDWKRREERRISSVGPAVGWFPVARRGCWILDPVWRNANSGVIANSGVVWLAEGELVLDESRRVDANVSEREGNSDEREMGWSGGKSEAEGDSEQFGCTPCGNSDSVSGEPPWGMDCCCR